MSDQVPSQGTQNPRFDGSNLFNVGPPGGGITTINGDGTPAQVITGSGGIVVTQPVPGTTNIAAPSPTPTPPFAPGVSGIVVDPGAAGPADYLRADNTFAPLPAPPSTDGMVQVLGRVAVDLNAALGTNFIVFTVPVGKRAFVLEFLADEFSTTPVNAALDFGDTVDPARWDLHNGNIDFSAGSQQPVRLTDFVATVSNRNSTPSFAAGDQVVTSISNPEGAPATCFVSAIGYYR